MQKTLRDKNLLSCQLYIKVYYLRKRFPEILEREREMISIFMWQIKDLYFLRVESSSYQWTLPTYISCIAQRLWLTILQINHIDKFCLMPVICNMINVLQSCIFANYDFFTWCWENFSLCSLSRSLNGHWKTIFPLLCSF